MQKGEGEVIFSRDLHHYLRMAIEVWPTLKSSLKHLSEVGEPHAESFLPKKNYSSMQQTEFIKTIADDLFDFIMNHDVKAEDIQDYLDDVLQLLMVQEELIGGNSNPASTYYMSNYTIDVMDELQKGRKDKVEHFEKNIYEHVKLFKGQVIEKEEGQGEYSGSEEQEYSDEEDEEEEKQPQKEEKTQQQLQRQKELQDDGWTIVTKKKK